PYWRASPLHRPTPLAAGGSGALFSPSLSARGTARLQRRGVRGGPEVSWGGGTLPAEPASHRGGANANLARVQSKNPGDDAAGVVWRLHRGPQRDRRLIGANAGDGGSAILLHRHWRDPLGDETRPNDDRGTLERVRVVRYAHD